MIKLFSTALLLLFFVGAQAQKSTPKADPSTDGLGEMFEGKGYRPGAIIGGSMAIIGSVLYVVGSEGGANGNYTPSNSLHYAGIGFFATGAVLYSILTSKPKDKRDKPQKSNNASDWEITD